MFKWLKKQFTSEQVSQVVQSEEVPGDIPVTPAAASATSNGADHAIVDIQPYLQQAAAFFQEGKLDEAKSCYQQVLALNPRDAPTHNKLGDIYYEQQAWPQAEAAYRQAIACQPEYSVALLNLGLILDQQNRLPEAEACYRQALHITPDDALAHYNLSITLTSQNRRAEAESSCRRALEIKPEFSHAHFHLATLLQQQSRLEEAEVNYREAIRINPDFLQAHFTLGGLLQQANKANEAITCFEQILLINPDLHEARNALLGIFLAQGRYPEAEVICRSALELQPEHAPHHFNLSMTLRGQGKTSEAEVSLQKTLALEANFPEAYYHLAVIEQERGRHSEAETSFHKALALQANHPAVLERLAAILQNQERLPELLAIYQQALASTPGDTSILCKLAAVYVDMGKNKEAETILLQALALQADLAYAHGLLGGIYINQGRYPDAEASLQKLLKITPDNALAYDNLGSLSYSQGRFAEAITRFKTAVQHDPSLWNAYNNLASAYKRVGRLQDAQTSYLEVLQMQPNSATAHNNLALVHADLGQIEQAVSLYRKALEIDPSFAEAHGNLLFVLNYHPELNGNEIYAAYEEYDRKFAQPHQAEWHAFANPRLPNKRLKIGYVTPDMNSHSIRHFLEPLLARHDKNSVEVHAYAHLQWEDAVTARYKTYVDHWIPTLHLSDQALAARIRADGIDILVDLAGHTGNSRLLMFARKPAPVSVSWLGFAYTTGVKAIDYMLMDGTCMPPGCESVFAEHPWRMDTPGYCYRPAESMGAVGSLPALQRNYITFGCLSRAIRINDKVIAVWTRILKKLPDARLIIDSTNFNEDFMREACFVKFEAHGISRSRLEIGFHSPPWDTMRKIDIGLDCFPHNSGTTLFESLYMGVPYVTLADRPSMGLLGSSILEGAGHPEWIARSEQEYIDKAVALARDIPALAQLRLNLREQTRASALMDEPGFTRKVEAAYRAMWTKWCEQNPIL
ncbi:tetratricopeptide repeat protein [Undibacterium sp. Di27W]|uniref:tetratricopeptide repeat protein n=1 Tax=Undibacterium sp. Di27W TaxID=3413036 RepID=UPI003BF32A68